MAAGFNNRLKLLDLKARAKLGQVEKADNADRGDRGRQARKPLSTLYPLTCQLANLGPVTL